MSLTNSAFVTGQLLLSLITFWHDFAKILIFGEKRIKESHGVISDKQHLISLVPCCTIFPYSCLWLYGLLKKSHTDLIRSNILLWILQAPSLHTSGSFNFNPSVCLFYWSQCMFLVGVSMLCFKDGKVRKISVCSWYVWEVSVVTKVWEGLVGKGWSGQMSWMT